jgi:hypothetical protein
MADALEVALEVSPSLPLPPALEVSPPLPLPPALEVSPPLPPHVESAWIKALRAAILLSLEANDAATTDALRDMLTDQQARAAVADEVTEGGHARRWVRALPDVFICAPRSERPVRAHCVPA